MRFKSPAMQVRNIKPSCESLESRQVLSGSGLGSTLAIQNAPMSEAESSSTQSFISRLPSAPTSSVSTIPANGDVNPYGVAKVPRGFLVTNFNNANNLQGTGTTIQKVFLNGKTKTWYQAPKGFGLTDAIGVLSKGFVFVGSVPTTDGTSATVQKGSLFVLNRFGDPIANYKSKNLLDGPWGMAVNDQGNNAQIFVSNVLSGTITRLNVSINNGQPSITSATTIAKGFTTQTSTSALVLGPTGLAYDASTNVLYVASTADNAIYAVSNASSRGVAADKGTAVVVNNANLHGPVGLTFSPGGDLLVTNGDAVNSDANNPSLLLQFSTQGTYIGSVSLDPAEGAAFGIVIKRVGRDYWLAAVNDDTNALDIYVVPQ